MVRKRGQTSKKEEKEDKKCVANKDNDKDMKI